MIQQELVDFVSVGIVLIRWNIQDATGVGAPAEFIILEAQGRDKCMLAVWVAAVIFVALPTALVVVCLVGFNYEVENPVNCRPLIVRRGARLLSNDQIRERSFNYHWGGCRVIILLGLACRYLVRDWRVCHWRNVWVG